MAAENNEEAADLVRNAPAMPKQTCPAIDRVLKSIRAADATARLAGRHCEHDPSTEAFDEIRTALSGIEDELEKLRLANSSLRESAEYWQGEALALANREALS